MKVVFYHPDYVCIDIPQAFNLLVQRIGDNNNKNSPLWIKTLK